MSVAPSDRPGRPALHESFAVLLGRIRAEAQLSPELDAELVRFADQLEALAPVAGMIHDLRSPIGALLHQAELLADESLPPDVRSQSLAAMEDNASALSELLERLSDR